MKPETTLKEVLKPPFSHDGIGMIYDENSRFIDVPGINFNKYNPENWQGEAVAKIRGWGVFQYYENGEQLQDDFKNLVVKYINEGWERDFCDPLRWEIKRLEDVQMWLECPKCGEQGRGATNYCPSCGVRLLPPGDGGK